MKVGVKVKKCANIIFMNGLISNPKILDKEFDELILNARKEGYIFIQMLTPSKTPGLVRLEVSKIKKGWCRVGIDIDPSNYAITTHGREEFYDIEKNMLDNEDRRNPSCSGRTMAIETKETGEGMVLAFMLMVLEDGINIEYKPI